MRILTDTLVPAPDPPNPSTSTGKRNKARYHNFLRAGDAQQVAVQALRPYVQWAVKAQHAKLLSTPITAEVATAAGCANTSSATTSMTLKDVPPCEEHVRAPESTRIRHRTLKQCKRCNPWLEAMGAAHADGKVDKLNVSGSSASRILASLLSHHNNPPATQAGCQHLPQHLEG